MKKYLFFILCCLCCIHSYAQDTPTKSRFFQSGGAIAEFGLPLIIPFQNEKPLKVFDTYHFSIEGEGFTDSKPLFGKTKLRLSAGAFVYFNFRDIIAQFSQDDNDTSYGLAFGLKGGAAFNFNDKFIVGATFPFGTGYTPNQPDFRRIAGITPYLAYQVNDRLHIKAQFPLWSNSLSNVPVGLVLSIGHRE